MFGVARCFSLIIALTALFVAPLVAGPVLLWDANSDANVAGYKVYVGNQSGTYSTVTNVGLQTSNTLSGLRQGMTYYFAVTAYTSDGLESEFSEEIHYTPPVDGITWRTLPTGFTQTNGTRAVLFSGKAGQQCTILASTDLRTWREVRAMTLTTNGPVRYLDGSTTSDRMLFYRVVANPP